MSEKECKDCKEEKQLTLFNKSLTAPDGREGNCKECRKTARKKYVTNCVQCGESFRAAKEETKHCSRVCSGKTARTRYEVSCNFCGSPKEIVPHEGELYERFYCNKKCQANDYADLFSGERNPSYNSVEVSCSGCNKSFKANIWRIKKFVKLYCSKVCYGENITGENNPFWNPKLTNEERTQSRNYPEYVEWRSNVFSRDLYTCVRCKDCRGGNLEAHHIKNYSEHVALRLDLSNGITLCKSCHKEFHDEYGYRHNNKNQLDEFFSKTPCVSLRVVDL